MNLVHLNKVCFIEERRKSWTIGKKIELENHGKEINMKKRESILKFLLCGLIASASYSACYIPTVAAYTAVVASGDTTSGEVVNSGEQIVYGTIENSSVTGNGKITIASGGQGKVITVEDYGTLRALPGGTVDGATMSFFGQILVGTFQNNFTSLTEVNEGPPIGTANNIVATGGTILFAADGQGENITVGEAGMYSSLTVYNGAKVNVITLKDSSETRIHGTVTDLTAAATAVAPSNHITIYLQDAGVLTGATIGKNTTLKLDNYFAGATVMPQATNVLVAGEAAKVEIEKGEVSGGSVSGEGLVTVGVDWAFFMSPSAFPQSSSSITAAPATLRNFDVQGNGTARVMNQGLATTSKVTGGLLHVVHENGVIDQIEMTQGVIHVEKGKAQEIEATGGTIIFTESTGQDIEITNAKLLVGFDANQQQFYDPYQSPNASSVVEDVVVNQGGSAKIAGVVNGLETTVVSDNSIKIHLVAGELTNSTIRKGATLVINGDESGHGYSSMATDLIISGATANIYNGVSANSSVEQSGLVQIGYQLPTALSVGGNYQSMFAVTPVLMPQIREVSISDHGRGILYGNGFATDTTISDYGIFELRANARAEGTIVEENGQILFVEDGIYLLGNTILDGGNLLFVSAGDLAPGVNWQRGDFLTVNVDHLRGNGDGTIYMNVNMADDKGDFLTINSSLGSYQLSFTNHGADEANTEKRIVVKTAEGGAQFSLRNGLGLEVGGYLYDLRRLDLYHWALVLTSQLTTTATAGISAVPSGYLINYGETQTLLQRMGDLRSGDFEGNVWARTYGGDFSLSRNGNLSGYDLSYWGLQVGADKKITLKNNKGDLYLGGFFGYTKGNLDFHPTGSGEIDSKSVGLYGSYMAPSGFYTDLVLKYNWMNSEFRVLDTQGAQVTGKDLKTDGPSVSLEVGKRFHFDSRKKEGWYVEPQVQFSWGHQSGGQVTASNGLKIKSDSYNSVLGRIGTHIGYEVKEGKNPINIYGKLSYVHEFDGDMNYHLNGAKESMSFGDSWWVYGLGVTAKLGDRHQVYFDVERAEGGVFTQDWAVNGGYRYSW